MESDNRPTIKVKISPRFNVANDIVGLQVILILSSARIKAGSALVTTGTTGNQSLIPRQIEASDASGPLRLQPKISTEDSSVSWIVNRTVVAGDVTLKYRTVPLSEASRTIFKATGLYADKGGLLGSGLAFIPVPPGDESYLNIINWDLSHAPPETRAVWTYGEGPSPVKKYGPTSILTESVYMVGPVKSNPPNPVSGSISDYYGVYWFGILPPNVEAIKDIHHSYFLKVSELFNDIPTPSNPYRSFILNTGSSMSISGTSFTSSHIFAYDDQISAATDYDLIRRLTYEVSNLYLGPPVTAKDLDHLYEGIKHSLSIYLPTRLNFRTDVYNFRADDYFRATINVLCIRYYTSPLVNIPLDQLVKLSETIIGAKEHLEARAWAFVFKLDLIARHLSNLNNPLEDLAIIPLAHLRREGKPHGITQFLELLKPLKSDVLLQSLYSDFTQGRTILFPTPVVSFASLSPSYTLKSVPQETLDFGLDQKSFEHGVIFGLKPGSRAQEAGLKDGDKIVWSSHQWICVDQLDAHMEIIVERDGEAMPFRYWPRGRERVEGWEVIHA